MGNTALSRHIPYSEGSHLPGRPVTKLFAHGCGPLESLVLSGGDGLSNGLHHTRHRVLLGFRLRLEPIFPQRI